MLVFTGASKDDDKVYSATVFGLHGSFVIYVSMNTQLLTRKLRTRWIPQYIFVLIHVLIVSLLL